MELLIPLRFVHFTATLVAGGTVWFGLLLPWRGLGPLERRLRSLIWAALAVAVLSGGLWFLSLAASILDAPMMDVAQGNGLWPVVTDTRFGQVAAVRLGLVCVLAVLLLWRRPAPIHGLLALGLVALPALTGHAGAKPGVAAYAPMAGDMVHLTAAAAWLGALPAFALTLASRLTGDEAAKVTRHFGQVALGAVAALALSGLVNSWYLLSGPRYLIDTAYGRLLTLKLFLFAGMLAVAAVNRLRLTPALPSARAQRALTRTTLGETALGLGILCVVAILGTTPPGGHVHAPASGIPADSSFVHIHTEEAMADVTIEPGRVGPAAVTIRLWRGDMTELPARGVRLALDPPNNAAGSTSEHVAVRDAEGNWRIGGIALTQDGAWTVRVIVMPREGSPVVLDAPIVIAR
jgi:putative copper resistance protein D